MTHPRDGIRSRTARTSSVVISGISAGKTRVKSAPWLATEPVAISMAAVSPAWTSSRMIVNLRAFACCDAHESPLTTATPGSRRMERARQTHLPPSLAPSAVRSSAVNDGESRCLASTQVLYGDQDHRAASRVAFTDQGRSVRDWFCPRLDFISVLVNDKLARLPLRWFVLFLGESAMITSTKSRYASAIPAGETCQSSHRHHLSRRSAYGRASDNGTHGDHLSCRRTQYIPHAGQWQELVRCW